MPRCLQSSAEGVLHDILRQREVVNSEHASQGGDHPPRLASEEMLEGFAPRRVIACRLVPDRIARR